MKRTLRVRRGVGASSRFERYTVDLGTGATLLDALETIRTGVAPDLCYRHSCHHGSCGTCSVLVDGRETLACLTDLESLYADDRASGMDESGSGSSREPTVEPLRGFVIIADLAIDPGRLFRAEPEGTTLLRESERREGAALPAGIDRFTRFEDCIECGLCVSACPVTRAQEEGFMGPAALAALHRETINREDRKDELLDRAEMNDGVPACERHFACSRVCPRGVNPGRHIQELRKEIAARRNASTGP